MTKLYSLHQVQFTYAKKPVLDIDHLEIESNSITAILGNNGAGKSTLLKVLALLETPQHGFLKFKGKDLSPSCLLTIRRRVIFIAQKPYLLHGTVMDNVVLGLKFRGLSKKMAKKEALKALEKVGVCSFANRLVTDLSGGEAQKVALARAFALKPEVLLLDEAFSHLDQESTSQFSQLIKSFANSEGRSVVFSTHDQDYANSIADKLITLVAGKLNLQPLKG